MNTVENAKDYLESNLEDFIMVNKIDYKDIESIASVMKSYADKQIELYINKHNGKST